MNQRRGISAFALKIVAIASMTCNHVANVFCPLIPSEAAILLYALGGLTFPIMCFLLVEGYRHTSDLRKYARRLALFALISQIPYSLLWGTTPNVMWTLLIGLGIIWAYDNLKQRWVFWLIALGAFFLTDGFDWGGIGLAMALLFHVTRGQRRGIVLTMLVLFISLTLTPALNLCDMQHTYGFSIAEELAAAFDLDPNTSPAFFSYSDAENLILQSGFFTTNFAIIGYALAGFGPATLLLYAYNGHRGRPLKFLFYAFYPAHLALIWLLSLAI